MTRTLYVLGDHPAHRSLHTALANVYTPGTGMPVAPSSRASHVDRSQVLFIDPTQHDESTLAGHDAIRMAMDNGIPIVILEPSSPLLTAITGVGTPEVAAAILVNGNGVVYSKVYMGSGFTSISSGVASVAVPGDEAGAESEDEPANGEPAQGHAPAAGPATAERELTAMVIEDLERLEHIESTLVALSGSKWVDNDVPSYRKFTQFRELEHWESLTLSDPSYETSKSQTVRFHYSVTLHLLAANEPATVKVVDIEIGGAGFYPDALIRDDTAHRGWGQSLTAIKMEPLSNIFGHVQSYVPVNSANDVAVTTGFSWELGFSGGAGPEGPSGSVSFSFSKNASSTVSYKDFNVLAEPIGEYGMQFYHNAYIVGGDTKVDPRYWFVSDWNGELSNMFYYHFPDGDRVRSWPDLSKRLVAPNAECVWYASPQQGGAGTLRVTGIQGVNYFYKKKGWKHAPWNKLTASLDLSIDFGKVAYQPPKK